MQPTQSLLSKAQAIAPPRKLLVHHVALRLSMKVRTVRWNALHGKLVGTRIEKKIWQFEPRDVEAFARRRHAKAAE